MTIARAEAIIPMTPGADHSAATQEGLFVKLNAAGNPIVVVSATATVPFGVILDGEAVTGQDSIGVCGGNFGPAYVRAGAAVTRGYGQLESDGAVINDAGAGARIVVCLFLESGVADELVQAVILTPVQYT